MYHFLIWDLLNPFFILVLLTVLGLVVLWRKPRGSRVPLLLVTVPFTLLVLLSLPAVCYLLRGGLEWQYPALTTRPEDVDAIVVLGSDAVPADGARAGVEVNRSGWDRCMRAAELYHQGKPCPVVVTGGKADASIPGPAPAEAMREVLLRQGVAPADVVVEAHSRTTFENAVECSRLLKGRGLRRVALVTNATHLPRAVGCFRKQQVTVVPCGCTYRATPRSANRYNFVPNANAELESQIAFHEWVGLGWYWVTGKM